MSIGFGKYKMGCGSDRMKVDLTEQAIIEMEQRLRFCVLSPDAFVTITKKYSEDEIISEEQWPNLAYELGIPIDKKPHIPKIEEFYEDFKQDLNYSHAKFHVLGILLSIGDAKDKAKLLFKHYGESEISQANLAVLAEMMLDISCRMLPSMVDDTTGPPASEAEVTEYAEKLQANMNIGKNKLVLKLSSSRGQEIYSIKELVKKMNEPEVSRLMEPHGLRKFLSLIS